jgi:uncharacterized hydrophobic protein (TIGR00271 family)
MVPTKRTVGTTTPSPTAAANPPPSSPSVIVEQADIEEGLVTVTTLTQGSIASGQPTSGKDGDDECDDDSSSSSSSASSMTGKDKTDASETAEIGSPFLENLSLGSANPSHRISLEEWAAFVQQQDEADFGQVDLAQIERIKVVHDRFVVSFNFNTLILVASVLAALGLVSNSVATIIASMLVSPIIGPVAGMAYGFTIRDWNLVKVSVINECGSLVFCILVGVVVGAMSGAAGLADTWPTPEMAGRGTLTNFYVGLPIAFFSGLGVAVALLDEHFSSLVGVAISASLLPPAVNAGIMWVAYAFYDDTHSPNDEAVSGSGVPYYDANEFRTGGVVSLSLTLANVVLVAIAAAIIFRIKEAVPMRKKLFWSDLAVARKIFQRRALAKAAENLKVTSSRADQLYKQARVMSRTGNDD